MLSALARLLSPALRDLTRQVGAQQTHQAAIYDELEQLKRRIRELEGERLALLTEWGKTRDQVLRYMKRVSAIKQREELADDPEGDDELDRQVLRLKLGGAS